MPPGESCGVVDESPAGTGASPTGRVDSLLRIHQNIVSDTMGLGKVGGGAVNRLAFDVVRRGMTEVLPRVAVPLTDDRHRYAPCRPRSNPSASDLMTAQAVLARSLTSIVEP